jgi:hypothetical protein
MLEEGITLRDGRVTTFLEMTHENYIILKQMKKFL